MTLSTTDTRRREADVSSKARSQTESEKNTKSKQVQPLSQSDILTRLSCIQDEPIQLKSNIARQDDGIAQAREDIAASKAEVQCWNQDLFDARMNLAQLESQVGDIKRSIREDDVEMYEISEKLEEHEMNQLSPAGLSVQARDEVEWVQIERTTSVTQVGSEVRAKR